MCLAVWFSPWGLCAAVAHRLGSWNHSWVQRGNEERTDTKETTETLTQNSCCPGLCAFWWSHTSYSQWLQRGTWGIVYVQRRAKTCLTLKRAVHGWATSVHKHSKGKSYSCQFLLTGQLSIHKDFTCSWGKKFFQLWARCIWQKALPISHR